jgi:thioredoxin 1
MIATVGPDRLRALRAEPGLLLIDLWQQSCAPCRKLEPRLEAFAQRHPELTIVRVDIDTDLPLAQQLNVMSIPTVLALHDGAETARLDGLITEDDLDALAR